MRTTGAVVLALLVLASCGRDAAEHDAGTTTTTGVPSSFESCHESNAGPHGSASGSKAFGPLGAEPSVVVHLPRTHRAPTTETTYAEDRYPDVDWARVAGATIVAASPAENSDSATSIVTAVNDDGTVRWTRCLPGSASGVSSGEAADLVLVAVEPGSGDSGYDQDGDVVMLDAEDGSQRDRLDADQVLADSSGWAVIARYDRNTPQFGDLHLVDLRSGQQTRLGPASTSELSVDDDGVVHGPDGSIWQDGAWVPDPDPATKVDFDYELGRLRAHRGADWTLPLQPSGYEGTELVQDDDTVVAWACESRDADGRCALAVVGVDLASGKELWRRRGDQLLALGGDGAVLIQHGLFEGAWALHDMRTGQAVPGQAWADDTAFQQGCCEEGRWRNVGRVGGTVVVQHDTDVRVWFPKAHSHATVDVQP